MKRLYYMTADLKSTERISLDLHAAGITDWHFHVFSKDEAGLHKYHIHSVNLLQQFDIIHSGERGALIGITVGIAAAISTLLFAPFGEALGVEVLAIIVGLLAMFGAWVGGMIGLSRENYKLSRFHNEVENGKYLIMVDINKDQEHKVREIMQRLHPEAMPKGEDSTIISPFEHSVTVK